MATRNLGWLIDRLRFKLNVNPTQVDQDFIGPVSDTIKWYRDAVNEAGDALVEDVKQEGHRDWFTKYEDTTWNAGVVTKTIPVNAVDRHIITMRDITADTVGSKLDWSLGGPGEGIFFVDNKTLQYGSTGPSSDMTIRIYYEENYKELTELTDEPEIIPSRFRWVLVWAAVDILKTLGDESVPRDYSKHLQLWKERWFKFMSYGRPRKDNPAVIENNEPDQVEVW